MVMLTSVKTFVDWLGNIGGETDHIGLMPLCVVRSEIFGRTCMMVKWMKPGWEDLQ
jgi:hypothetical protein